MTFDAPKALDYAYVMFESSKYVRTVRSVAISDAAKDAQNNAVTTNSFKAASRAGAMSRAFTLPDIKYPEAIPNDTLDYEKDALNKGNYCIKGGEAGSPKTVSLKWNTSGINLYVTGYVNFTGNQISNNYNVYLMPGAVVCFTSGVRIFPNASLYLCEGSKVIGNSSALEVAGNLFNNGTVETGDASITTNELPLIYNVGKISCNKIDLTNQANLYNEDSISAKDLNMTSSGNFVNFGSSAFVKVTGTTTISNSNNFDNDGEFVTETLTTHSGANITNNCRMSINSASLEQANITVNGDCYIYIKSISKLNNSYIKLGDKALLEIDSDLNFNGGANTLEGPTSGNRALFYVNGNLQANNYEIIKQSGLVTRTSKEDFQYKVQANESNGANAVDFTNVELGEASGCGKAFTLDKVGSPLIPKIECYTFAFEDMFERAGDYDFNDVVVKVDAVPQDGELKVALAAAGATKNLYVHCKVQGKEKTIFKNEEVHKAFGVAEGVMVNTGSAKADPLIDYIEVPEGFSIMKDLDIYITGADGGVNGEVHIPKFTDGFTPGNAPYALLVATDWDYPSERQRVTEKYGKFADWAKDAEQDLNWYTKEE